MRATRERGTVRLPPGGLSPVGGPAYRGAVRLTGSLHPLPGSAPPGDVERRFASRVIARWAADLSVPFAEASA